MASRDITIRLPESTYLRLQHVADATQKSLTEVLLYAVRIGLPPEFEDAPAEFQSDLAALDQFSDDSLWQVARSCQTEEDMVHYQELLKKNADQTLTEQERSELNGLRIEADRFMLRKAHAAALLRWRGHLLPPAEMMQPLP